ncbi:histone deacetylase complex subunit SAP25 isoform X6 [Diceros bicornis minor]|uniref:histone deacetylase complex subunit SAP25 isoform X6 n=1 Tax=Diceros bicornis minor TaxID=77932 RepID=UPI0026F03F93|nr:histone deacetylase complex subunit SAP25 isoform X6 [Diceros bicornis minor]
MLPWPPPWWDAGEEQVPQEEGPWAGSDPDEAWDSGEEALGEPGTPPPDSPHAPSRRPSWIQREQLLPQGLTGLAAEQPRGTPVPLSPQMAWDVAPSRMTLLAPWDLHYEAKAGPRLVWAGPCVIPHSGRCTRQLQAGASDPWPLQQDIRMESRRPGMQTLCCPLGSVFPCTCLRPLSR